MTLAQQLERAWRASVGTVVTETFWYFVLACSVWLAFSIIFRRAMRSRKISTKDATAWQMLRELLHSVRSIAIFGLVTALIVLAAINGWTQLYGRVEKFGWTYFYLSIVLMVVVHDTYFYWTHRLMHHPRLYRTFHHTHHLSTNPTPWAAYAFSPWEALVQAGIGPLIIFTMPTHPLAFATFMLWQIGFNVLGHCGYEIFPSWLLRSRVGVVLNSITHHAQHHEKFRANYGLYFNVWDRVMGTNHRDYETRFTEVTSRAAGAVSEPSGETSLETPLRTPHGLAWLMPVKYRVKASSN